MDNLKVKLWSRINLTACSHQPLPPHRCPGCGSGSRRFCRNGTRSQKGRGGSGRKWQVETQDGESGREEFGRRELEVIGGMGVWKKQEEQ